MTPCTQSVDFDKRCVRIVRTRENRFVEFEFSIGSPDLYVELVLPFEAFERFCRENDVEHLTPEQIAAEEFERLKWRFGLPGISE